MFVFDSVVHEYHVYKEIWSSVLGKELQCTREIGNIHDLYAVKVVKPRTGTVGHLPKEISRWRHWVFNHWGAPILLQLATGWS